MSAPYSGRCNCGAVTVRITAEPIATRQCWCRQCQRIAAGGGANNAMFPSEAVAIAGDYAETHYVAASGTTITHAFCPGCGTPILSRAEVRPHIRTIRFGLLDPGHGLSPATAIWTVEAPDWAMIDPAFERFERQPPLPSMPSLPLPSAD